MTPRLDEQLCFQLYTASRLVTRAYRPVLGTLGVSYPQYLVLLVLWESRDQGADGFPMKALGERLYLDSGTLTPLLKRMERLGLVHRARDGRDERNVVVRLTEDGSRLSAHAHAVPQQLLCEVSSQEVSQLIDLRDRLRSLVGRLIG